jgi:predicted RNA binding protein YcfA (HicA-like mRNA interferase family)
MVRKLGELVKFDICNVTIYSYIMRRREKLITKAGDNPKGLSLSEFQTLLSQSGWVLDHQTGSHQIWYSPGHYRLSVQEGRSGKAKGYQVEQFLARYELEREEAESGET